MFPDTCLLQRVLAEPQIVRQLGDADWDLLIRQGRAAYLLAKLCIILENNGLICEVPVTAKLHLEAAKRVTDRFRPAVLNEIRNIKRLLGPTGPQWVVLKGAAYVFANLSAAQGRVFSDIDILVPKTAIDEVEESFNNDGWTGHSADKYDQRYYREWMHEIPPLRHFQRGTSVDIHHSILPPTASYKPDPEKILAAAIEVNSGIEVLCPEDMIIHSTTHLFHEGEFEHGLRDLVDIDELLGEFAEKEPEFWDKLVPRAVELGLIRPLYYGLHYARTILGTPVPKKVMREAEQGQPNFIMSRVMDVLFLRALAPDHPTCDRPFTGLARWLLYVRSHYLRMPLYLLVPHLVRKAWKSRFEKKEAEAALPEKN